MCGPLHGARLADCVGDRIVVTLLVGGRNDDERDAELLDLKELFAPVDAPDHEYYDTVPAEWAKRWPDEEIWRLRLRRR